MDPDATLEYIRDCVKRYHAASERGDADAAEHFADSTAEAFAALDEWMSRGGFAPAAWRKS